MNEVIYIKLIKCVKGFNGGFKVNICCVRRIYLVDIRDKVWGEGFVRKYVVLCYWVWRDNKGCKKFRCYVIGR